MDYQTKVMNEVKDINRIMGEFIIKISKEHHKHMDGVWGMRHDSFHDLWQVEHHGYWLDDIESRNSNLLYALQEFKEKLSKRIKEEIDLYDFKKHCAKEVIIDIIIKEDKK